MMTGAMERVTRSAQAARASYNAMSRWYDWLADPSERPFRQRGLSMLALRPGDRVLEIGFGTGHALVAIARTVGEQGRVVGIDISDGMARIAAERVAEAGLSDHVELCLADGARCCFAPSAFTAIFISFTLELFDTPVIPTVLAQCRRMLDPGGRISVVALVKEASGESLAVRLYEWFHRRLPRWIDCRPITLRRLLVESGFSLVRSERRAMWGLPVGIVLAHPKPHCI